jgi:hypothetical protein
MNFKEFISESGKALKELNIEVSRINKQEFLEIEKKLQKVLNDAGIKIQKWQMGSAGSWSASHPYSTEESKKQDAGDVDVMLDLDDVRQAFPAIPKTYARKVGAKRIEEDAIDSSKLQLSEYLAKKGFPNNGVSLNLNYPLKGKNVQVDLIVTPNADEAIHAHTLDYTKDVGMRGSDLWNELYHSLVRFIPSPISGKLTLDGQIDRRTGEAKSALQLSHQRGLVDRETDKVLIPWSKKDQMAQVLLGPEANARDLSSLSGIKNILQNYPEKWAVVKKYFPAQMQEMVQANQIIAEGIEHPEDSIFSNGIDGAVRAFKELSSLAKNSETVSLKWDGFPAIIFGWKEVPSRKNPNGQFLFVDKHMFDKMVKGTLEFTTIEEYDVSRGKNRSSLWEAASLMVPVLKRAVPAKQNQFFFGDLMWSGIPKIEAGYYTFEPNTVKYKVKIDSETGRTISRSIGGIAVHTFIPGMGNEDRPLRGLQGLREDEGITFLVGELPESPKVSLSENLLNSTKNIILQNKRAVQKFLSDLEEIQAVGLLAQMRKFITAMLNDNDIATEIIPRFLKFLVNNLSPKASIKLLGTNKDGWLYREGSEGLYAIWAVWAALTDLKLNIKKQIDIQQIGLPIQARIGEEDAHEGYVFGSGKNKLKLIDRLGFSRANFAKNSVQEDDLTAKSKMPMAAFCFGRMNPPTIGHKQLMQKTVEIGGVNSFIFLSNTQNVKKDPLDPATKLEFVKKIYPEYNSHLVSDPVLNPIFAANYLYSKGFRNLTFVAGADRLGDNQGSIEKILTNWNRADIRKKDSTFGPEGREQVVLNFVSSGARDADADVTAVSGVSASLARRYAVEKNQAGFQQATGVNNNITVNGKTLYQAVREGLGLPLSESFKAYLGGSLVV